jgi:hypothetical protein
MFKVNGVYDRTTIGPTAKVLDDVSIEDFPFSIYAKSPPFAFGKVVAVVTGENYEDAKKNADYIFKALDVYGKLLTTLREVGNII